MSAISNELEAHVKSESTRLRAKPAEQLKSAHHLANAADSPAIDLATVERRYGLWRGRSVVHQQEALPTGHKVLDDSIHIGGWPRAGLLEVLLPQAGVQEFTLLMPAIAQHLKSQKRVALIGLPYLILPSVLKQLGVNPEKIWCIQTPKIEDQLWAMQQLLQSGHCLMVLAWQFNNSLRNDVLRKLQVAAKTGQSCGVVFRHERYQQDASPASMRIHLSIAAHKNAEIKSSHKNDYMVGNVMLKLLKQPKSFAGKTVALPHALKKHQQLVRQGLPEFTVAKTQERSQCDNKPQENEASVVKNSNSRPLFSIPSFNS